VARDVGIKDVADHAGVSDSTVSNVINRPELVAERTLNRVRASMAELGFVVNAAARQLRLGDTRTLGMVLQDIGTTFFADFARDCADAAERASYSIMLSSSDQQGEREDQRLRMFEEQRIAGLLVIPVAGETEAMRGLADRGVAMVAFGAHLDETRFCSVVVDDEAGGRLAVEHLIQRGRKEIVYIGAQIPQVAARFHGGETAALEAGVSVEWIETSGERFQDGDAAAARMLSRDRLPNGIFASNDAVAAGALRHFLRAGVRIPQEIAIVGHDDADIARQSQIELTTIRQPREVLAEVGVRLLLEHIGEGGGHHHQFVTLMPELVIRESS